MWKRRFIIIQQEREGRSSNVSIRGNRGSLGALMKKSGFIFRTDYMKHKNNIWISVQYKVKIVYIEFLALT